MKTKTIKQVFEFDAEPHEVYEALIDSKKHSEFTDAKAVISRKVGGKFSVWGGYAEGKNIELIPDKKVVQSWRAAEEDWPTDHYSTVTFSFSKTKNGTKMSFTQTGVPETSYESISQGWKDFYWKPMESLFRKSKK